MRELAVYCTLWHFRCKSVERNRMIVGLAGWVVLKWFQAESEGMQFMGRVLLNWKVINVRMSSSLFGYLEKRRAHGGMSLQVQQAMEMKGQSQRRLKWEDVCLGAAECLVSGVSTLTGSTDIHNLWQISWQIAEDYDSKNYLLVDGSCCCVTLKPVVEVFSITSTRKVYWEHRGYSLTP